MQRLQERKAQIIANQNRDHSADLDELKLQLEEMLERRMDAEQRMQAARHALEAVDSQLRQLEQARAEAENNALAVRNELEKSAHGMSGAGYPPPGLT